LFASANRDETRFPDPDRFDIYRKNSNAHLGFGLGIHHCIGASLARTEARIAFEIMLNRMKDVHLAAENSVNYTPSFIFRGLKELHLEFAS